LEDSVIVMEPILWGTRISQLLAAGQCVYYNPHIVIFWRIRRTVEDATQAFNDGISAN